MTAMKVRLECLKIAATVACQRALKADMTVKLAQEFYDFVMSGGGADDEDAEPEPAVEYVGNHPRNLTHMYNGKQIWPKLEEPPPS